MIKNTVSLHLGVRQGSGQRMDGVRGALMLLAASLQGLHPLLPTLWTRVPGEVGLLHVHEGRDSKAVTSMHQQRLPRPSLPAWVKEAVLFACPLIE